MMHPRRLAVKPVMVCKHWARLYIQGVPHCSQAGPCRAIYDSLRSASTRKSDNFGFEKRNHRIKACSRESTRRNPAGNKPQSLQLGTLGGTPATISKHWQLSTMPNNCKSASDICITILTQSTVGVHTAHFYDTPALSLPSPPPRSETTTNANDHDDDDHDYHS